MTPQESIARHLCRLDGRNPDMVDESGKRNWRREGYLSAAEQFIGYVEAAHRGVPIVTDIKLIHRSKAYADELLQAERDMALTDGRIRTIMFNCWQEAYTKGYAQALSDGPHKEDMGR